MVEQRNPYAAPRAHVDDVRTEEEGNFIPEGRKVSAGRGWAWISEGMSLFMQAPGVWVGLMLVWFLIIFGLALIPFIGGLATNLLFAVFMAGIMIGCKAIADGDGLRVGHLFAGFQRNTGQLILIGVIFLVGVIAIGIVVGVLAATLGRSMMSEGPNLFSILLLALIMLALMLPIIMAIWFAPALTGINDMSAMQSVSNSFKGCIKNILPFLVWGLVFFLIMLVFFGILAAIAGASFYSMMLGMTESISVGVIIAVVVLYLLFAFTVAPVMMASTYAAYRDIYYED